MFYLCVCEKNIQLNETISSIERRSIYTIVSFKKVEKT